MTFLVKKKRIHVLSTMSICKLCVTCNALSNKLQSMREKVYERMRIHVMHKQFYDNWLESCCVESTVFTRLRQSTDIRAGYGLPRRSIAASMC